MCEADSSDSSDSSYQAALITTFPSTWLSLVSLRALFWSMPLSPLEQNCFLLAAQPQMQAEETRRSAMCCRSRTDSDRAHSFFSVVWFFSGLIYSCKLHIFQLSRLPSPVYFPPYLSPLTASGVHLMANRELELLCCSQPLELNTACVSKGNRTDLFASQTAGPWWEKTEARLFCPWPGFQ